MLIVNPVLEEASVSFTIDIISNKYVIKLEDR